MASLSKDRGVLQEAAGVAVCPRSSALLGLRPTKTGLVFVAINLLIVVAAMSSEVNLLFLIFCLSMGMLAVCAVGPVLMVRRVEADRSLPQAVVAGRAFTMSYLVRNGRRWGCCWSLIVGESPGEPQAAVLPRAFVARLGPRSEDRLELLACCPRRGRLKLRGIRITSRFPVGLFSCSVDLRRPGELVVFPEVGRLRVDLVRKPGFAENRAEKRGRGHQGDQEFAGVREYRQGDNYRWIHWRRSAHTGELVVREYQPLQASQLIVLLDPWPEGDGTRQSGGWGISGLAGRSARVETDERAERIISAAATAACDALERGHRVGLIARAKVPVVLAPAGGRPHRQRLLHEMALLSPEGTDGLDKLVARIRWTGGWHARCLLFVPQLTEVHRRAMRFVSQRAETVAAAVPGTEWFEAVFSPAPERGAERRSR